MLGRGLQHAVSVGQRRGEWLFDDAVDAALSRQYQRFGVLGVGRTHADDVESAGVEHRPRRVVMVRGVPALGEIRRPLGDGIATRDYLSL